MAIISDTEVGATRQEVVAALVQEVLKQKSVLIPTVSNYSSFAVPGSYIVDIPKRTQFAAADKTEDTDLTAQALTFTVDQLLLNKHKAIYSEVEMKGSIQSNVNVRAEVLKEQAMELALQVDKDIITQLKLVSTAAPDHLLDYANSPTDTIQQTDILEARKLLNIQKVPMGDRFMMVSPDQEKAMLLLSDFVRADAYGSAGGLINGEIGRVYGFTVLMHTELSAAETLYWHKSHAAYATQMNPDFKEDFDLKGIKAEYLLHMLYGSKVLDSGKRGVFFNGTGA
jgi:N4-gp56 family major capsid protein